MSNHKRHHLAAILPLEIWQLILSYCNFWDYVRFRQTCKRAAKFPIVRLPDCCFFSTCSSNHFRRLDQNLVNKLTGLQYLKYNYAKNRLSSLNPLTNLTKLKVRCYAYKIIEQNPIIFDKLTKLEFLHLIHHMTNVNDWTNFRKLTKLKVMGKSSFKGNQLNMLTNLLSLDLFANDDVLNVSGLILLTHITAPKNIQNEEINMLTNLLELDLQSNQCSNVYDINALCKLTFLKPNHLLNSESIINLTNLLEINMNENLFPLGNRPQLTKLALWSSPFQPISNVFISGLANLIKLKLHTCLPIEKIGHLTNLKKLGLFNSEIPDEELLFLTNLESLKMKSCKLTSIGHLTKITSLQCQRFNGNFKNLTSLKELVVDDFAISWNYYFPGLTKLVINRHFFQTHPHNLSCTSLVKLIIFDTGDCGSIDSFPNLTYLKNHMKPSSSFINQITNLSKLRILKGTFHHEALLKMTNLEKINITHNDNKIFEGKRHVMYI